VLIRKQAAVFAIALAFVFSFAAPLVNEAFAQEQASGSGLQVSPTRNDVTGQKGEQKTITLILKNITNNDVTAQAFLNDFESDNNSGTPQIIVDQNQRTPYSLEKMLKDLKDVDLKAGETKEVKLVVDVPGDAAPGAYFGAIRYAAVPKGQSQSQAERQVALTASVAHLVFLEVPGEINEQIQVNSLKAVKAGKEGSFFFSKPDRLNLNVSNKGNGFSRPFGQVTVNGLFGKQVQTYEVNNTDPRGIVLPNSTRIFNDELKGVSMPGKYNLTASVAYGNGGEVVTYKSSFIYLPLWAIIVFLALIALIAAGVFILYRKRFAKSRR
jgi:hypothetical protein